MSAFMCDKEHIDALVTAAVDLGSPSSPFRWMARITTEEHQEARVAGVAISSGDMALARDRIRSLGRDGLSPGQVGAMLLAENARSVNFRYNEEEWEQPYSFARAWSVHNIIGRTIPRGALFKAIDCYEYQACETPDWKDSEAYSFCQSLRDALIRRVEGYDAAEWGWKPITR